jgi:uncharacterized membrane protein
MSFFYISAGIMHFVKPKMYVKIIPPYFPNPKLLNVISGLLEIIFGIGLIFTLSRTYSAIGIVLLLIAVFPANIYMYRKGVNGIPRWLLLLRLPLQFVLIAWAWVYI